MKTFLTLTALVISMFAISSDAQASSCNAHLENGRGRVLEYFYGYGYDRRDACDDAKRQCIRARRNGRYQARVLTCVVEGRGGRGGNGSYSTQSCSADLIGRRGRNINTFRGSASAYSRPQAKQQACRKALRQCNRYKTDYGHRGASCRINDRMGRGGNGRGSDRGGYGNGSGRGDGRGNRRGHGQGNGRGHGRGHGII